MNVVHSKSHYAKQGIILTPKTSPTYIHYPANITIL